MFFETPDWLQLYILVVLFSAAIAAALAGYAWRQRGLPGAAPAIIGFGGLALWAPADILAMTAQDLPTATFWINVGYVGSAPLAIAWLVMILQYTGREQWLERRRLALLCAAPFLTIILVWTNGIHGLVYRDVRLNTAGPLTAITYTAGPWFWINAGYSYLVGAANGALLISFLRRTPALGRSQVLAMLIGAYLPGLASVVGLFDLSLLGGVDLAPVFVGPTTAIAAWAIFRRRLFDIAPIARHKIVDGLADGVIVLDGRGRIVDLNRAAQQIFGCSLIQALGQLAEDVFSPCAEVFELYHKPGEVRAEFSSADGSKRYYDGHASPLFDGRGHTIGRAIVLRDITERKQMEDALRESEQRYRVLTNSLPETVYETDLQGWLTYGNPAGLEKFGFTEEELAAGINVFDCIAPESREAALANFKERLSGGQPTAREFVGLRKDGSRFPIVISATQVIRGGVTVGLTGVLVDMSERKRIESLLLDQHRTLAMLEGHERLARDVAEVLHGRVQNKLLLALHQLDACESVLQAEGAKSLPILAEAKKLIEEVREKEIREASHRLHPSIIDLGLIPAVRSLAAAFDDCFRVDLDIDNQSLVKMDDPVNNQIPAGVRLAVYRILEEALSNAHWHGKACEVKVSLSVDLRERLSVSVQDDGRGFEIGAAEQGLGLKVIAGRAQSVGGMSAVFSAPGKGTRVEMTIPLPTGSLLAASPALEEENDHSLNSGVDR